MSQGNRKVERERKPDGKQPPQRVPGGFNAIPDRKISKEACQKYGVRTEAKGGVITAHHYPWFFSETGGLAAVKTRRFPDPSEKRKDIQLSGTGDGVGLFGQDTCGGRGKYITITEGELDCLAVAEAFSCQYDVVSIRNGAGSAYRELKESLEWLEGYDHVVLMFDNDEEGQKAVDKCRELFSPGKLKVAALPLKDPCDMLRAGRVKELQKCFWDAKEHRPDGIVSLEDTFGQVMEYINTPSVAYPFPGLEGLLLGQRTKEVVIWSGPSGIGKSHMMRELADNFVRNTEDSVALMMLEESIARTTIGMMSFYAGRPLHREMGRLSQEDLEKYWQAVIDQTGDRVKLLDHQGWGNNLESLKSRLRYMRRVQGCKWIILDHMHIALSSITGASGDWSGIDEFMTDLQKLVHELDIGLHLVAHQSDDKVLRGSKGIKQLADAVVFLERDPYEERDEWKEVTHLACDKNRFGGELGSAGYLRYSKETGRYSPCPKPDDDTSIDREF